MSHYRTAEQVKAEFGSKPRRALVITTIVHESRAVQAHIPDAERIAGANGTIYEMGRFSEPAGDWHVIHVITQAGNSDASVVATKAHSEFGKFNVQIFIGVAGSLKEDIPIGSVVVGEYVYNTHSAKVDDKGHYSRPHSHGAAPELVKAAQLLILDGDWVDFIRDPKRTKLPGADVYPCRFPPEAILKGIASGEQVVAGGNTEPYQIIRQHLNDAGAVEMEGWGAMNAAHQEGTSAIVVRGISDMCAGKEYQADAMYQPIASAHAAAFAFAILSIRSKASPLSPSLAGLPAKAPETHESTPPSSKRTDYIVNFKGSPSDWSPEEFERVVEGLRKLTGDPKLMLLRVDAGSIRLVVSVRESDVPSLTLIALKAAAGDLGDELLGAVTAQELSDAEKANVALHQASAGVLSWEQTLPGGGWLERPEKLSIESRFNSEYSATVVLGEPGSGKSALMAAIATDLVKSGASVLAIKADFVSTGVHNEQELQIDLGLPALPGELIERLAHLQPVFLLIDQLDALASQIDLRSDRLNVLLNLVRRVGELPNVHIVLSARTFEFNHDVRLKAIDAEAIALMLPAWHEVKDKLTSAGIDAETWPQSARDVVRNPQALKIYLTLAKDNGEQPFSKYQSMLERLWRQRITTAPDSEALASLATDIAGTMAEEETLWIAASRFDVRAAALERLEAVGLIVRSDSGKSIAFSHQTVFDYVLARSFVRTTGRLSSYVLERQSSLFVRPKLWSALRYLRDAEITSYEREFLQIWREQELRRHLKLLLIEFLGELHNPVAFEMVCVEEAMRLPEMRIATLKSIIGSPGWFTKFSRSVIPAAMIGSEPESTQALRILQRAWLFSPDEVVRLIREQWLPIPAKDVLTWAAMDACPTWNGVVEETACTVLSRTAINPWQVDYAASVIAVNQPEIAFRLIRAQFDFLLQKIRTTPTGKPFPKDGAYPEKVAWQITDSPARRFTNILEGTEWTSLPAMAEAEPQKFLEILWPWFRAIFNDLKCLLEEGTPPHVFPGLYSVDIELEDEARKRPAFERPILSSLRLAIEGTASRDPEFFLNWVQDSSGLEFMAPQRLIAHGLSCSPETYAKQAFRWLFEDPRRFQLGNSHGIRRTSALLVNTVSPYWTDGQVREFESGMETYRPKMSHDIFEPKQRWHFRQFIRATRALLLAAVPPNRLSERSRSLIESEKIALGEDLDQGIRITGPGFIGSPMDAGAMAKAKDRDILKIFGEIPDETDWDHPKNWMRGGNVQLSRAFAEFAKTAPERAFRIIEQFEPRTQERAAGYALESIAETGGYGNELQDAMLDLYRRGFGAEEFRNPIAHAIEKISNRPESIHESLVAALIQWLSTPIKAPAAPDEILEPKSVESDSKKNNDADALKGSVLWGHGGISILPGGNFPILSALTSILLEKKEEGRNRLLEILNDHLSREGNPKVWQALLIRLSNAGGSTPAVVSNFLRKLFSRFPELLATRETVYFLAHAQRWDDVFVHEIIAPWEDADNAMLRQAYGELVGLVSLIQGSDRWLTSCDRLIERGSPEGRTGLAYAGANLWIEPQFHAPASNLLTRLIPSADRDGMSAILDVFRLCDDLSPKPTVLSFLQALAAPEVDLFDATSAFIVEKLQSLLPHAAGIIGEIALKLVAAWYSDLGNMGTARASAAPQLTDLAITLHRLGGISREIGVTVFETLIDLDAYGARESLAEIDGRFGIHQTSARRRISRKPTGRSKRQ